MNNLEMVIGKSKEEIEEKLEFKIYKKNKKKVYRHYQ